MKRNIEKQKHKQKKKVTSRIGNESSECSEGSKGRTKEANMFKTQHLNSQRTNRVYETHFYISRKTTIIM